MNPTIKQQATCRCWLLPALAVLLAWPFVGQTQWIVYHQLPPSPSLGLVQDINGNWSDPFAPYDSQGLRLLAFGDGSAATYSLILNGQLAYTFYARGNGFGITSEGSNNVIGGYLDNSTGAAGAYPLLSGALIGSNTGTTYTWIGTNNALPDLLLAARFDSGIIGNPISFSGPFAGLASAYMGLQFYQDGQVYYGWVRLGAPAALNGGWIYEYGYQTIPNTPIFAGEVPEPSTWAFLAAGAAFLLFHRKKLQL